MGRTSVLVGLLLAIFVAELLLSVRQNSQTFDESNHLYAGYSYWKRGDFGINPEHPPLVEQFRGWQLISKVMATGLVVAGLVIVGISRI